MTDDATPPADLPAPVPTPTTEASTAQMPAIEPLSEPLNEPEIVEIETENPAQPAPPASAPPTPPPTSQTAPAAGKAKADTRELLAKANTKKKMNKEAKLEKILAALAQQGRLSNDDVQKLLKCSDATATRHLSALVKQGKVRKEGKTGAHVVYVRV
jgi:uncharacterized membrane protein